MSEYRDLIGTRKLPTGAKVFYFADGKYKFFPSKTYVEQKEKFKVTRTVQKAEPSQTREHCDKLIEDIFSFLTK